MSALSRRRFSVPLQALPPGSRPYRASPCAGACGRTRQATGPFPPSRRSNIPFNAFEQPHVDAKTMEIHHDRHHAAYVANVNTLRQRINPQIGTTSRSWTCSAI